MKDYSGIIAIDLGTTNCVISMIKENGDLEVIENTIGEKITPSFIYYGEDEILVGKPAKDKLEKEPNRVFHSYKPLMSTAKTLGIVNGEKITPERCSTEMLKYLKKCAEELSGVECNKAVITVPAYFNEVQKYVTKVSAEDAGLEVIMLPTEPTAGAYHYSSSENVKLPMTILVYDFGGGTFDACIQTIHSLREVDVHTLAGDKNLGGDDVNIAIAKFIYPEFDSLENANKVLLINSCNDAKITLTNAYHTGNKNSRVKIIIPELDISKVFTTKMFLQVLEPIITRTMLIIEDLLSKSPVYVSDIHEVLLVGGSTRLPLIREKLIEILNDKRFNESYFEKYMTDPDLAVGYGANRLIKEVIDYGEDVVTNTLPIPIKLVVNGTDLMTLFQEDTNLPARRNTRVFNTEENQSQVRITIVEDFGNKYTEESVKLGELVIPLPEKSIRKAEYRISLRLVINNYGILTVKVGLNKADEDTVPEYIDLPITRNITSRDNKVETTMSTTFGGK